MRWLELKNATGDFTVEFVKANPYILGAGMSGINHISSIEYWAVESSALAVANVELSFDNVNSGGVTDVSSLRVARFAGVWENEGNVATTGSAGASGSVISNSIINFSQPLRNFTLASMLARENPLPLKNIDLYVRAQGNESIFEWVVTPNWNSAKFILEFSIDRVNYQSIGEFDYAQGKYHYQSNLSKANGWYRIKALTENGIIFSNVVALLPRQDPLTVRCNTSISSNVISIYINSRRNSEIKVELFNDQGQVLSKKEFQIQSGYQVLQWPIASSFPHGVYFVVAYWEGMRLNSCRLVRE